MTKARRRPPPPPRTTLPLTGTTRLAGFHLDHSSELAVAYAQAWLQRAGGLKVPASGVVRIALQRYVAHLEGLDDRTSETREAHRACRATTLDDATRDAAWKRMHDLEHDHPLPPFPEVLYGPHYARDLAAFEDRVDALAADILANRRVRSRPPTVPSQ